MKTRVATLKSIELAGFKSFAKRTKIEFGNGLVAIVGPNGSGKSNIADAVRWVFGEHKNKSLRTDKSEDLIYHGGSKNKQASMAEVVINLDNSAGSIKIGVNEIEITRRLYRSGESIYLLNGKRTNLSTIADILSQSGFGVGSYTVIGQGTIDKLILSSVQERKLLFEEASGIKQFEIKISQTLKRMELANDNLAQINNLINNLLPHHQSLLNQNKLLQRRNNLSEELENLRASYLYTEHLKLFKEKTRLDENYTVLLKQLTSIETTTKELEREHSNNNKSRSDNSAAVLARQLKKFETQKEKIEASIAELNIKIEHANTLLSNPDPIIEITENEIQTLKHSLGNHTKQRSIIEKMVDKYSTKLNLIDEKINQQTQRLESARSELAKSQKSEYLKHSLGLIDIIQDGVKRQKSETELAIVFYKLKRMIKHSLADNSAELAINIGKIQNVIARFLDERESISESQTAEIIKLRAIEMDYSAIESKIEDLNKSLIKAQNSVKSKKIDNQIESLSSKLNKLVLQRNEIAKSIDTKRNELIMIADTSMNHESEDYYKKHEQLSNDKIAAEQNKLNLENNINNIRYKMDELTRLAKTWKLNNFTRKPSQLADTTKDEINKFEAEISLLEEINPDIAKEAKEVTKQMDYLSSQKSDLEKAIINLKKVISETETKLNKIFDKNFYIINNNFSKNVKQLFGGGDAELKLTEGDERGIEIVVNLPNKKSQNISSLSGGEKALASVALLSAILEANPSPFIVLDEVDAALDAENTIKFTEVLEKITKHSQVLVVTHNHDTMAVANELIGVTTSGDNDSHIVRVELSSLPEGSVATN